MNTESRDEWELSSRSQIVLVGTALAFAMIFGIALYFCFHMVPPPPPTNNDEQIAGFFAHHGTSIRVGAVLAMTFGGFSIPLAAVVAYQMARLRRGMTVWAIVQGMGGALVSVWIVFPAIVWGAAAFTPERPANITRAFSDLSFLSLITTTPYFIFQILPIAYVCLSHRVDSPFFPRWFGYYSVWAFLVAEVGAVGYLTKFGPFAWNGLMVFWLPFALFFVWLLIICYLFVTALRREAGSPG